MKKPTARIYLEKRYKLKNGKHSVKLKIYDPYTGRHYYTTNYSFTVEEFESFWKCQKVKKEFKDVKDELLKLEYETNVILNEMIFFDKIELDKKMGVDQNVKVGNVLKLFEAHVKELKDKEKYSTSDKYHQTHKLLAEYIAMKKINESNFGFIHITDKLLKDFEDYSIKSKKHRNSTISINMRNIRAIYNMAIKQGLVSKDSYPFGKDKYVVKHAEKVNKGLTKNQLKLLWEKEPSNEKQAKAKDFWFFSYFSYGMNTVDICKLQHKSIVGDIFTYIRTKTKSTKRITKENVVKIGTDLRDIIERRKDLSSEYLFGIINSKMSALEVMKKVANFNEYIVKYFRLFAVDAGLDSSFAMTIGTYHARHSFASNARKSGASDDLLQEAFKHEDFKATQRYINSIVTDDMDELNRFINLD
jgi:integrase/recombinase XerD